MGQIINTLAPVFLVIALGAALQKGGLLKTDLVRGINRLIYWVALPALLFIGTATAEYRALAVGPMILSMAGIALIATVIAVAYARLSRLSLHAAGTFVHVSVRANLSFVGLPVVFYVLEGRPDAAAWRAMAFLVLAPFILVQNSIGLLALLVGQHQPGRTMLRTIARDIATHPVMLSTALGALVAWLGLPLPPALTRSFEALGDIASPLSLLTIGAALCTVPLAGHRTRALVASAIKVGLMPAAGYVLGRALGLGNEPLLVMLVFLACPTGASSFSLVAEMGGDEAIASATIVLSTLLSALPLALIVALAG